MIHAARHASLGSLLDDAFVTYPSDLATIEATRDREIARLRYADFGAAARRLAGHLASEGIGPDDRVGIVMGNGTRWLLAATAILWRGAVIVPLDPRLTPEEQATLLQHAGVRALIAEASRAAKLPWVPDLRWLADARDADLGEHVHALAYDGGTHDEVEPLPRTRDDLACLIYTSGTGGTPKACRMPHRAYLAQYDALAATFSWQRGDRYLSILPSNHAIDFMCGYIASFATGTTVVHQTAIRPGVLLDTMRRYRPTQMAVVPLVLEAFDRAIDAQRAEATPERQRLFDGLVRLNARVGAIRPRPEVSRWLLKPVHDAFGGRLRVLFCGGAFTPPALARRFADLGLPVAIGYGLTEACTVVTVNDLHPVRDDTVGAPVPGVSVRIDAPDAEGVGAVQVQGDTVFTGYDGEPEATAAAFTEDGWLRTGDLGWIDAAGHLHLVGRARNMVVTAEGKNVLPEDVEQHLHDVPCEHLTVMAEDYVWPRRGLTGERLIAIVTAGDRPRDAVRDALRTSIRRLPPHKRPAGVLWWDDAPPLTATFKVRRPAFATHLRDAADRADVETL